MNKDLLLENVNKQYNAKRPFVIYALPEENVLTAVLQKDDSVCETEDFKEDGFVMAPFDFQQKAYCIPLEKSESFQIEFTSEAVTKKEYTIKEDINQKEVYTEIIKNAIRAIKSRDAKKIVISRKKEVAIKKCDFSVLLHRILQLYPTAFRYIWYHPNTGIWCGASPEVLVQTEGPSFSTMALAGTQQANFKNEYSWSYKEIEEQQIVVDDITTSLQKVTSVVKLSKTYNHEAGSLVHLRTDISGILKKGKTTLSSITSSLHPTPAVCGTPQKYAKKYILDNEKYDREYYTGFLGPVSKSENYSKLYVNLRCMKVEEDKAYLFVGGGITLDSLPESEWEETVHKLQTMLQVLQPLR